MPKKIIITNCSTCPYKRYNKNRQRVCQYSDYRVINVAVTTIPEWCELENFCDSNFKKEDN